MPLVAYSNDFGIQKLIFCSFLAILGCWRALGRPSGPHRASRAEKERKKNGKGDPIGIHFGSHLGTRLSALGAKKSVPEAFEGDFVDIVKP